MQKFQKVWQKPKVCKKKKYDLIQEGTTTNLHKLLKCFWQKSILGYFFLPLQIQASLCRQNRANANTDTSIEKN